MTTKNPASIKHRKEISPKREENQQRPLMDFHFPAQGDTEAVSVKAENMAEARKLYAKYIESQK